MTTAGCEALVVCGGDGTVNEVVNALMADAPNKRPALAVAPPWGTANILAHGLGVPMSPTAAAAWLARARPQPRAVGVAVSAHGTRYFAAVASAGYDAAIVHALSTEQKRRWGKLAFVWKAASDWRRYFPAPIEYEADGVRGRADGIIWGLTRFYGGRLRLGTVDLERGISLALRGQPRGLPWQALGLATRGLEHAPGVERLEARSVSVLTPGIPFEIDGESAGFAPVAVSVQARALTLLCAPQVE